MSVSSSLLGVSKGISSLCSVTLLQMRTFRTTALASAGNLYNVLGLKPTATQKEIKEAFYALSKLHHPDISGTADSSKKFQEISSAYEILGDPNKRKDYDRGLVVPIPTNQPSFDFPSKIDLDMLRKAEPGSFEANYVRRYNRNLKNTWAQRSDESISKTAFENRFEQKQFVCVIFAVFFGWMLGGYGLAKSKEEPIPYISLNKS